MMSFLESLDKNEKVSKEPILTIVGNVGQRLTADYVKRIRDMDIIATNAEYLCKLVLKCIYTKGDWF